jgi:hypothetical protein
LVEGETDAAACWAHGVPALGIPGATSWKPEWTAYLEDIPTIFVWQEPGGAGKKFVDAIAGSLPEVYVIPAPPAAKDPCALAHLTGEKFAGEMLGLMSEAEPAVVGSRVLSIKPTSSSSDPWWDRAKELFPIPEGSQPLVRGVVRHSARAGGVLFLNVVSNTWHHPANALYKCRYLYCNVGPRLEARPGPFYSLDIPLDDWSDQKREALARRVARQPDCVYFWVDNLLSCGVVRVITDAPLPGWDPIDSPAEWLADALLDISPPPAESGQRFRPFGGSRSLTQKAEDPNEEDKHDWNTIAMSSEPVNFVEVQLAYLARGLEAQSLKPFWRRSQWGAGLFVAVDSLEAARELVQEVGGYWLTAKAYAAGADVR